MERNAALKNDSQDRAALARPEPVRMEPDRCLVHAVHPARVAACRAQLLDDEQYSHLAEMFRTLADATRAKIVYSLLHSELCTCDLAAIVGVSDAAVSQHLRILRYLRVVKSRREGKLVYYSLDDAHVRTLLAVAMNHLEHWKADGTEEALNGGQTR